MSNKTPIFPFPESQHFSDYGFDPQFDYFQVLEEARKHKRESSSRSRGFDTTHFKLQKPISKDDSSKKIKKNKKRWWKNAIHFLKGKWPANTHGHRNADRLDSGSHRGGVFCRGSISGPVYITESRSGSSTPYSIASRPSSGPLAGTLTPAEKDEFKIPYISLTEINMDAHRRISTSAMPVYLVT